MTTGSGTTWVMAPKQPARKGELGCGGDTRAAVMCAPTFSVVH